MSLVCEPWASLCLLMHETRGVGELALAPAYQGMQWHIYSMNQGHATLVIQSREFWPFQPRLSQTAGWFSPRFAQPCDSSRGALILCGTFEAYLALDGL